MKPTIITDSLDLLDDLEEEASERLSSWETNFCSSLRRSLESGNLPTTAQMDKLTEIHKRLVR